MPPAILRRPDSPEGIMVHRTDPDWIVKRTRIYMEHIWYGGDCFPPANVNLGAAGHAVFS